MRSDKTNRTNKAAELFYRLSLRKDFRGDITKVRDQFGIPTTGMRSDDNVKKWLKRMSKRRIPNKYNEFAGAYIELLEKYKLPNSYEDILEDHILSNGKFPKYPIHGDNIFCEIHEPEENEILYERLDIPHVKLIIFDQASQDYIRNYLSKNWKLIKRLLTKQRGASPKRIRKTIYKERNELVIHLYEKSKKELECMIGRKIQYKDIAISSILKNKYGLNVGAENVRRIYYRYKNG